MTASDPTRILHRVAPMDRTITIVTGICLAIPFGMAAFAALRPGTQGDLLGVVALGVLALYGAIWLWMRPTRFLLTPEGLRIEWPARTWTVPWNRISRVESLSPHEARQRLGSAMRIGVGGLWGGFGLLWSDRLGMVTMYLTRCDGMVFLHLEGDRPLLITPSDPEAFVASVASRIG